MFALLFGLSDESDSESEQLEEANKKRRVGVKSQRSLEVKHQRRPVKEEEQSNDEDSSDSDEDADAEVSFCSS